MIDAPLVSVVVPVYNHAGYVEAAIRSVFAQDVPSLEMIVIDDGSKDESAAIAERVLREAPPNVTVTFRSRPNRGAHATINEGLDEACGRYLTILNSDDAFCPGRLSACIAALEAQGGRLAFTYVEAIDGNGHGLSPEHPWRQWYADGILQELDLAPTLSTLLLSRNLSVSTGNLVFRAELYRDLGGFRDYRYAHDVDFVLRSCVDDEPVLIREPLYRYRLHGSNTISESDAATEAEYEDIVHGYLQNSLTHLPANPFAPSLQRWTNCFEAGMMAPHVRRAIDRLLEPKAKVDKASTTPSPSQSMSNDRPAGLSESARPGVTLISHELSFTGAPVLLRDVARGLRQYGFSGRLLSVADGPLGEDFHALGFPLAREWRLTKGLIQLSRYASAVTRQPRVPQKIRQLFDLGARIVAGTARRVRIARFLYLTKLDRKGLLFINSFASWPLALPLAKRWKGPVYWYIHETYDPAILLRSQKLHNQLRALVEQGKVQMLFGSDATRAVWARCGYDGSVHYWSGFSRNSLSVAPEPKQRRIVLSVQSIGTRKGTRALVEAFAHGRREGLIPADAELRIVGCHPPSLHPLTRDLLIRVNEADLRGAVRLFPGLPPAALAAHYEAADIYIQTSIMECLPLALLNAMEHGLPIVSTDADGCREAIENETTGLLVPQRAGRPIAEALGRLMNDPELAVRLARAARQRFEERFSVEATLPALVETLDGPHDDRGPRSSIEADVGTERRKVTPAA